MLEKITIKNYILFDSVEIDYTKGFNVLVGQTGAGKSLILSAIKFALGAKADKNLIRNGESYTKVTLSFYITKKYIPHLNELGIECEDENLVITRILRLEGKTEYRVNGEIISISVLKQLGNLLIDFYYQNEGVELLNSKNHITMLDSFCGPKIIEIKEKIKNCKTELYEVRKQIKELGENDYDREREISLLKYQIDEIENANLKDNEEEQISLKLKTAINSEKISNSLSQSLGNLSNDKACFGLLKSSISELYKVSDFNENISKQLERLESIKYEMADIINELEGCQSKIVYDEREIDSLYKRIDEIKLLKKKYGSSISEINSFLDSAKERLYTLNNASEIVEDLKEDRKRLAKELYEYCTLLSKERSVKAIDFESKLLNELLSLGMKDSKLVVKIKSIKEFSDEFFCDDNGNDEVEFMFSANAGQELKQIGKSISGGEMSRFMLALKTTLVNMFSPSLIVLDEVDTGISGEVGTYVAEKIAEISLKTQVICITHMPQVTAMADNYVYIYKETQNDNTYSKARTLNENEQVDYIAKLFSMSGSTNSSTNSAKELKQWCNNYKQKLMNK